MAVRGMVGFEEKDTIDVFFIGEVGVEEVKCTQTWAVSTGRCLIPESDSRYDR
jgi:hypothetical protein